jgi:hypothetical protein
MDVIMADESRHAEKQALYLLMAVKNGILSFEQAINQLSAVMEQDDVQIVEKRIAEQLAENKKNNI